MNNHVRFFYLRHAPSPANKKGDPYACIIMRVNADKNLVEYQFSVCNPKDVFSRDVAHKACEARLAKNPKKILMNDVKNLSCHAITSAVMSAIVSDTDKVVKNTSDFTVAKGAPQRARAGALAWLMTHQVAKGSGASSPTAK